MRAKLLLTTCLLLSPFGAFAADDAAQPVITQYANIVYASYDDSLQAAVMLRSAIEALLADPSEQTLNAARKAWIAARVPYLQTEVYRFSDGPIDFHDDKTKADGPEGRLNAWPLNEAYIDYVTGNEKAGIINDSSIELTKATLVEKNQATDEANVATGYHAIEFLLWGQDLNKDGPGNRSYTDFEKGDAIKERRRTYLKLVTDLLVEDLTFLKGSWTTGNNTYAEAFVGSPQESLKKILTGMATLSGFEMASERMATALDSGDQEDEHSCFSDTTHQDFVYNAQGIANVYFGSYGKLTGPSVYDLLKAKDAALAEKLAAQINASITLIKSLPEPIDSGLLATPKDSPARKTAEEAVASLQAQAELIKQAGKVFGLDVKIVTE